MDQIEKITEHEIELRHPNNKKKENPSGGTVGWFQPTLLPILLLPYKHIVTQ